MTIFLLSSSFDLTWLEDENLNSIVGNTNSLSFTAVLVFTSDVDLPREQVSLSFQPGIKSPVWTTALSLSIFSWMTLLLRIPFKTIYLHNVDSSQQYYSRVSLPNLCSLVVIEFEPLTHGKMKRVAFISARVQGLWSNHKAYRGAVTSQSMMIWKHRKSGTKKERWKLPGFSHGVKIGIPRLS